MTRAISSILLVFFYLGLTPVADADWNQWRGPFRNGHAAQTYRPPARYPEELKQAWSIEVGIGHSSPVSQDGRVFQMSRVGEQEVVASYDLATGNLLWKDAYDVPYNMNPAATRHGKGPKSTPAIVAGKLYTFGINGVLSCYEAKSGKLLWRNDFKKDFSVTAADFGTAMSPLVDGGSVFVHAGGPGKGAVVSFEATTGKERWRWSGDEPAYASPVALEIEGVRQIVTQTKQFIVGLSHANGELLWKIPFSTEYDQNIITPVAYKDLLIFSGLGKGTFAVRIEKQQQKWTTNTIWQNDKASLYMSSPVVVGDFLYGMTYTRKGQLFCLDARNGSLQWISEGAEGENVSILYAGKELLFLNDTGELTVAKASPKAFEALSKYTVAKSSTWAHPGVTPAGILVKDQNSLTLWKLQ